MINDKTMYHDVNISLAFNKYRKYGYPSDEELIALRNAIALTEKLARALNSGDASNYYYQHLFDLINQVCRARNLPEFKEKNIEIEKSHFPLLIRISNTGEEKTIFDVFNLPNGIPYTILKLNNYN